MREITREIVSALIYSSDGKLLMGKKDPAKGGVYCNCWHIPGGGTDGEDFVTALIREIEEETGLSATPEQITLIDNKGKGTSEKVLKDTGEKVLCHMNFNVYRVTLTSTAAETEPVPTDDLVELRWFSETEIPDQELTPPSIELFTRLGLLAR